MFHVKRPLSSDEDGGRFACPSGCGGDGGSPSLTPAVRAPLRLDGFAAVPTSAPPLCSASLRSLMTTVAM